MNDTSNVGRLLAENTQMTQTDVVVGTATLGAYVHSSDLTLCRCSSRTTPRSTSTRWCSAHAERIGRITTRT
jgi:hypothetical protein